ncbi:hypothetical protein BH09GEM1_BH09GEM1_42910 [soil metagenome]
MHCCSGRKIETESTSTYVRWSTQATVGWSRPHRGSAAIQRVNSQRASAHRTKGLQPVRQHGHVLGTCLLSIALAATPMFGQSTVPSGTSVRITLTDLSVVEGRLLRADSTALTVAVRDTIVNISRDQVTTMLQRSLGTGTYARRVGRAAIIPGVGLGVLIYAIGAGGDRPIKWNGGSVAAAAAAGLAGGVIGASIGAITGAVVGSLVHGWTPVTSSVLVTTPPVVGLYGIESCGNGPIVEGAIGKEITGGTSTRLAVALTCARRVTGGAEIGSLGSRSDGTSESFLGAFTEFALGEVVLNPRVVTSLGAYHEAQPGAANVVRWRPGVGVGMAVAAPIWRHLSIGADARAHFSGNGNAWFATGLSGRYRP